MPSENHDQTLSVLNKALNNDMFSVEVRKFIKAHRNQTYNTFCRFANVNGTDHLVISDGGLPLNSKGPLPAEFNKAGIYIIVENGTSDAYIGSSIDIGTRMESHLNKAMSSKMEGTNHLLYSRVRAIGANNFTVTPIHPGSHFLSMLLDNEQFNSLVLTPKDYLLLDAFTKYELALTEQSYLDKMQSTLNGRHIATTSSHPTLFDSTAVQSTMVQEEEPTYVDYVPAPDLPSTALRNLSHWKVDPSLKIQILDTREGYKGNILGSFDTGREAARLFADPGATSDIKHMILYRYGRAEQYYYSPYLGIEVDVVIKGETKAGPVEHPGAASAEPLSNMTELPLGKVCAVSTDYSKVLGTFGSVYAAYNALDISPNTAKRNFGLKRTCLSPKVGECYLAAHPDSMPLFRKGVVAYLPVHVHDLQTNVITRYPSVTVVENILNIHHDFVNKHLNKGIYKRADGRLYKFIRPVSKANAL